MMKLFATLAVAYAFCVIGCTDSSGLSSSDRDSSEGHHHHDHDHHDHGHHAKSYGGAVVQIKAARDEVQAAFDAGTPDACDNALHEVAEILEALPDLAAESDLSKEDWNTVNDQSRQLFDQFMKIHDGFHGGNGGVNFEAVAGEINESIAILESKVAAVGHAPDSSEPPSFESEIENPDEMP